MLTELKHAAALAKLYFSHTHTQREESKREVCERRESRKDREREREREREKQERERGGVKARERERRRTWGRRERRGPGEAGPMLLSPHLITSKV